LGERKFAVVFGSKKPIEFGRKQYQFQVSFHFEESSLNIGKLYTVYFMSKYIDINDNSHPEEK
jgi:hypothetical protein